jgi:hypothetical protein
MEHLVIVIYAEEAAYVEALCGYFLQEEPWNRLHGFTEEEAAACFCRKEKADVLLVEEGLLTESLEGLQVGLLALLSRDKPQDAVDGSRGYPKIYRFQPADSILRQVHFLYQAPEREKAAESSSKVVGVYSPAKDPGQTMFCWELAKGLSRGGCGENKILYVGIIENGGFTDYLEMEGERDLSDLLFLSQSREGEFSGLLQSCVLERNGVYFVPPMEQPLDILLLDKAVWKIFLEKLCFQSGYDTIVLDIGTMFAAFWEALSLCSRIYLLLRKGEYAGARQKHFARLFAAEGKGLEQKASRIYLPEQMESIAGKGFVRELCGQEVEDGETIPAGADPL